MGHRWMHTQELAFQPLRAKHSMELLKKARTLQQQGRFNEAILLYEQLLADSLNETYSLLSDLGFVYHQAGKFEQAVEIYGRSLTRKGNEATTLMLRGAAFLELKRYQKALKDFNEAIRLAPYLDNAYWGRGRVFEALNDPSWAVTSYTRAIELEPDEAEYYLSRATALKKLNRLEEAEGDLKKADEKNIR